MEHLAIDIGGRESQICIRDERGKILVERRHRTRDLGAFLQTRSPSVVVVETCSESFAIADAARAAGHDVRVVSATLVRALGVGQRGIKTDQRDARVLSEASCRMDLSSVHVPAQSSRDRKARCGMHDALTHSRTLLINCVRGWLRATSRRPKSGSAETFSKRVRALLTDVPLEIDAILKTIDTVSEQLAVIDAALSADAKADKTCALLMSVPGVGPMTALRFVAAIDDPKRFESAHQVESYLGLTPGERSSSNSKHRTGITKAGSSKTRWCLVQAAWVARRCRPYAPMVLWADEVEKRRGKRTALIALARKLVGILFAMWRDGTFYDQNQGATMRAA